MRLSFLALVISLILVTVSLAGCVTPAEPETGYPADYITSVTPEYVTINNASIAYREFGSPNNPPLVYINGLGAVMDEMDPDFVGTLAEHYRVILYDHRWVGHSSSNDTEYHHEQLASDEVALIHALGYDQAYLFGHSMGATIGQLLMLQYPETVIKCVLCAPTYSLHIHGTENLKKVLTTMLASADYLNLSGPEKEMISSLEFEIMPEQLTSLDTHVLLITGTADEAVSSFIAGDMAVLIPNSWLIRYPGASHKLHYEGHAVSVAEDAIYFFQHT